MKERTESMLESYLLLLAWDASVDVVGYNIYHGSSSHNYNKPPKDVGNVTTYKITDLAPDNTWYFAATAYDAIGNESGYSNEVSKIFE